MKASEGGIGVKQNDQLICYVKTIGLLRKESGENKSIFTIRLMIENHFSNYFPISLCHGSDLLLISLWIEK